MGYGDSYTCKYVYASRAANNNAGISTNEIKVQLPFCRERTPNMKLQLVAAKLSGDTEFPGVAVRMTDAPSDYFSLDNNGAVLGIVGISYQRTAGGAFHYALAHDNNPEYVISSTTRFITVTFESGDGTTIPLADFGDGLQLIFKLEYPDQPPAGIVNQFAAEIHRGL
jgi:hypothetical protein